MVIKKYILSYIFFSYLFLLGAFCVEAYSLFKQSRTLDKQKDSIEFIELPSYYVKILSLNGKEEDLYSINTVKILFFAPIYLPKLLTKRVFSGIFYSSFLLLHDNNGARIETIPPQT